jgi:hypothetical protein
VGSGAADGAQLEEVVEEIERALLPEGFKVDRRVHVLDPDTGKVIAELDIVIKGPLGSSTVEWLIECRDRPRDGPAPVEWIEQLAGRRARFKIDRIFAVSTTGFSGPAEKFARDAGIFLRTVRTIPDMAHDFNVTSLSIRDYEFAPTDMVRVRGRVGRLLERGAYPTFRKLGGSQFLPMSEFVVDILRQRKALPEADGVETIEFDFDHRCHMRTPSGKELLIEGFRVPGKLHSRIVEARGLSATVYAEDKRVIGKQGQFEWETKGRLVIATVTITGSSVRIDVPDDQLPAGTKVQGFTIERIERSRGA